MKNKLTVKEINDIAALMRSKPQRTEFVLDVEKLRRDYEICDDGKIRERTKEL